MSWSFAVPAVKAADFEKAADAAKDAYVKALGSNDYALGQISSGQVDAAIAAAAALAETGVVGDGKVSATLSGHANPEHKPTAGYANEVVTISLACADTVPAAKS